MSNSDPSHESDRAMKEPDVFNSTASSSRMERSP